MLNPKIKISFLFYFHYPILIWVPFRKSLSWETTIRLIFFVFSSPFQISLVFIHIQRDPTAWPILTHASFLTLWPARSCKTPTKIRFSLFSWTPSSLNPELLIKMSLGSPGIKNGVWESKLGQILLGGLQDLAGQGFRKAWKGAWVRMTQAVGYIWILMKSIKGLKRAWKDKRWSLMAASKLKLFQNGTQMKVG